MMLRASTKSQSDDIDLAIVTEGTASDATGIAAGNDLLAFAEATLSGNDGELAAARKALLDQLGGEGLADAAAIVAGFNAIDRVADATGIPLDSAMDEHTTELRAELGIDAFAQAGSA